MIKIMRVLVGFLVFSQTMVTFGGKSSVQKDLEEANEQMEKGGAAAANYFIRAFNGLYKAINDKVGMHLQQGSSWTRGDKCMRRGNVPGNLKIIVGAWANNSVYQKSENWLGLDCEGSALMIESSNFSSSFKENFHQNYRKPCCTFFCCFGWLCCPCSLGVSLIPMCCGGEFEYEPGGYAYETAYNKAYEARFKKLIHDPMQKVICGILGCKNLPQAAEYWQDNFCEPVAELLQEWCKKPVKNVTINDLLCVLRLYKRYIESDCGASTQKVFSQQGYENTYRSVHVFLTNLIRQFEQLDSRVQTFLEVSITSWDENVENFTDESSISGVKIKPIGFYQVDVYEIGRTIIMGSSPLISILNDIRRDIDTRHRQLIKERQQAKEKETADTNLRAAYIMDQATSRRY